MFSKEISYGVIYLSLLLQMQTLACPDSDIICVFEPIQMNDGAGPYVEASQGLVPLFQD